MHVELIPVPSSSEALQDLHDWLMDEPGLKGRVRLVGRPPSEGELGGALDAVSVAVTSGATVTVLAAAAKAYFENRRKMTRVLVRSGDPDDPTPMVDIETPNDDAEALLRTAIESVMKYRASEHPEQGE